MFRFVFRRVFRVWLPLIVMTGTAAPALAQVDFSGEWANRVNEDQPERVGGPELGEFLGLPLNEAARRKAETWNADILSQPEQQARPHPGQYSMRAPAPNVRVTKIVEPVTGRLVAYTIVGTYGRADRVIWMDGRPHPSKYAEHTWQGFSTGEWVDGASLKVTTTHMKTAFIRRNGAPASYKSEMTEYFYLQGENRMLLTSIINDPVYLEEPFVRTTNFERAAGQNVGAAGAFEIVNEVDQPLGWVPHWPIGTQHTEFAEKYELPFAVTQGGKETLYPEYQQVIQKLKSQMPPKPPPAPVAR